MNWQRIAHRRLRGGTLRPRLEMLERRLCLSCTVFQDGATLYISGDNTANHVAVLQDDAGFQVACDGGAPTTFRGIERAVIRMGSGNDSVEVAYGTGIYRPADFQVDLGAGDDMLDLRANWKDVPNNGGSVKFDIWAGAGDDRVTAFLPYIEQLLQFNSNLGAGDDTFSGAIVPPSDPAAAGGGVWTVAVLGQQGDDHMNLMLGAPVTGAAPQPINTNLDVMLDGGAGADEVGFNVIGGNVAAGAVLHVGVDGGAGADQVDIMLEHTTVAAGASLSIDVDGGSGNDHEVVHNGANTWAGNVSFTFNGGAGADEIGFVVIGGTVATGASLRIDVNSGSDPDTIYFMVDGSLVAAGASVSIGVDAGSGNDDVRGSFGFDPETHGVIAIIFQGDSGDDNLTLDVSGIGDPGLLRARVDGGPGFDVAHVTRNVDVVGCEMVVFL